MVKVRLYVPALRSPQVSPSRFSEGETPGVSALSEHSPLALLPSPLALVPPSILKKKPASYRAFAVTIVSNVAVRSNVVPSMQLAGDTLIARESLMSLAVQLTLLAFVTGVPKT